MHRTLVALAFAMMTSCSPAADSSLERPELSRQAVRALYESYESALQASRADTLAAFYHPDGASIIINGERMDLSNAGIDSIYRGSWQGPSYFTFEDLAFDQLNSSQVLVTGYFRWLAPAAVDTGHVVYLAVVEQTEVGPRIRLEHETPRHSAGNPSAAADSGSE